MSNIKIKFAKIYDKYIAKIYRFAYLKLSSQELAEDITAQVFLKAWEVFRKDSKEVKNVQAFIYRIAKNEVANYYRTSLKFRTVSIETNEIADPKPSPEEKQQIQSDIKQLSEAIKKLNDDYQNIVIWRYLDGIPIKKVAQIMERPEGTVRVMSHRALKELRQKLEETSKGQAPEASKDGL